MNTHYISPYGWILMFKVSKNASFQNESFCIKHLFDWRSISGLRRRPPFRGCSWKLGITRVGISYRIEVFEVSNDASFQKKYLFIKQFFDWMSTNGLGGRSEAKNLTSSFMDGF